MLVLSGCASLSGTAPQQPELHLGAVPFWPQTRYQCGPAALASVLNQADVRVTPKELEELVFLPGRRGSLQAEMLAAPRRFHRIGYRLPPTRSALSASLAAGQPALVLLRSGWAWFSLWHYAVLIGVSEDAVWLHSGRTANLRMPRARFEARWEKAGRWAMSVPEPGTVPAALPRDALIAEVGALEQAFPGLAAEAYSAALSRWPDDPALLYGRGTAALRRQDHAQAAQDFRQVLAKHPESLPAGNNLALALAGLGRREEARVILEELLQGLPEGSPWRTELLDSLRAVSHAGD